jgi:Phosphoesterase family
LNLSVQKIVTEASKVRGARLALLAASSVAATAAIVVGTLNSDGNSALAAALMGELSAAATPVPAAPAADGATPSASGAGASPSPSAGGSSSASGPVVASAPTAPPAPSTTTPTPADTTTTPTDTTPATPSGPTTPTGPASKIGHVWVVSLASPGYDASFGDASQMPYLSGTLRPQGTLLPGYTLVSPAAAANNIAAISGQPPNQATAANCSTYSQFPPGSKANSQGVMSGDGCAYPDTLLTVADQLNSSQLSWRGYAEDMGDSFGPKNCVHPGYDEPDQTQADSPNGGYMAPFNPFIYFNSLVSNGACAIYDVPLTNLPKELKSEDATPNFSFIAPNACDSGSQVPCADGSAGGAASADAFLAEWVPQILKSAAYKKDGILIVTFGSADPSAQGPVGAVLVSRFLSAGDTLDGDFGPYSIARSIEDLFGLDHLGEAASASTKSFVSNLLTGSGD